MKTQKAITEKRVKKSFCDRLAEKLDESGLFDDVNQNRFGDSARWIAVRKGKHSMTFQFDIKGEKMGRIGIWEDVIKVVEADTLLIFNEQPTTDGEQDKK